MSVCAGGAEKDVYFDGVCAEKLQYEQVRRSIIVVITCLESVIRVTELKRSRCLIDRRDKAALTRKRVHLCPTGSALLLNGKQVGFALKIQANNGELEIRVGWPESGSPAAQPRLEIIRSRP